MANFGISGEIEKIETFISENLEIFGYDLNFLTRTPWLSVLYLCEETGYLYFTYEVMRWGIFEFSALRTDFSYSHIYVCHLPGTSSEHHPEMIFGFDDIQRFVDSFWHNLHTYIGQKKLLFWYWTLFHDQVNLLFSYNLEGN